MIYVVMGVSGCGKSSIGKQLAEKLGLDFYDADDFHSKASIDKMSKGIPLTDEDRLPWLKGLANEMLTWQQDQGGAVLACSALKNIYRDWLASELPEKVTFIYLQGSYELIAERLQKRANHFMNSSLLQSQFDTLEEPNESQAVIVNIDNTPEYIVEMILRELK
ncbi:gluconokinase [Catenovulum sediminis]|uniref:Gluconokinase n=1 Tax=Catenovulum sediminis TaxID=1740262 RepID=A0ABV1RJF5_9ALTE|nr:gluconokinase [Catenovulum sediminis]